jgi:hypothetical protein
MVEIMTRAMSPLTNHIGTVKLSHFSVKEYLISDRIRNSKVSYFSIREDTSHSLISQCCLVYLLQFDRLDSLSSATIQSFPLAHYAAEYWIPHAQTANKDNSSN